MKKVLVRLSLRLVIGLAVVLVMWNPLAEVLKIVTQQDPMADMGDGYIVVIGQGILYSPSEGEVERVISEKTERFVLKNPWLLGETSKGWFAINKTTNKIHYPVSTLKLLSEIVQVDISENELSSDWRPYLRVYPITYKEIRKARMFLIALVFIFIIGPNILGLKKLVVKDK